MSSCTGLVFNPVLARVHGSICPKITGSQWPPKLERVEDDDLITLRTVLNTILIESEASLKSAQLQKVKREVCLFLLINTDLKWSLDLLSVDSVASLAKTTNTLRLIDYFTIISDMKLWPALFECMVFLNREDQKQLLDHFLQNHTTFKFKSELEKLCVWTSIMSSAVATSPCILEKIAQEYQSVISDIATKMAPNSPYLLISLLILIRRGLSPTSLKTEFDHVASFYDFGLNSVDPYEPSELRHQVVGNLITDFKNRLFDMGLDTWIGWAEMKSDELRTFNDYALFWPDGQVFPSSVQMILAHYIHQILTIYKKKKESEKMPSQLEQLQHILGSFANQYEKEHELKLDTLTLEQIIEKVDSAEGNEENWQLQAYFNRIFSDFLREAISSHDCLRLLAEKTGKYIDPCRFFEAAASVLLSTDRPKAAGNASDHSTDALLLSSQMDLLARLAMQSDVVELMQGLSTLVAANDNANCMFTGRLESEGFDRYLLEAINKVFSNENGDENGSVEPSLLLPQADDRVFVYLCLQNARKTLEQVVAAASKTKSLTRPSSRILGRHILGPLCRLPHHNVYKDLVGQEAYAMASAVTQEMSNLSVLLAKQLYDAAKMGADGVKKFYNVLDLVVQLSQDDEDVLYALQLLEILPQLLIDSLQHDEVAMAGQFLDVFLKLANIRAVNARSSYAVFARIAVVLCSAFNNLYADAVGDQTVPFKLNMENREKCLAGLNLILKFEKVHDDSSKKSLLSLILKCILPPARAYFDRQEGESSSNINLANVIRYNYLRWGRKSTARISAGWKPKTTSLRAEIMMVIPELLGLEWKILFKVLVDFFSQTTVAQGSINDEFETYLSRVTVRHLMPFHTTSQITSWMQEDATSKVTAPSSLQMQPSTAIEPTAVSTSITTGQTPESPSADSDYPKLLSARILLDSVVAGTCIGPPFLTQANLVSVFKHLCNLLTRLLKPTANIQLVYAINLLILEGLWRVTGIDVGLDVEGALEMLWNCCHVAVAALAERSVSISIRNEINRSVFTGLALLPDSPKRQMAVQIISQDRQSGMEKSCADEKASDHSSDNEDHDSDGDSLPGKAIRVKEPIDNRFGCNDKNNTGTQHGNQNGHGTRNSANGDICALDPIHHDQHIGFDSDSSEDPSAPQVKSPNFSTEEFMISHWDIGMMSTEGDIPTFTGNKSFNQAEHHVNVENDNMWYSDQQLFPPKGSGWRFDEHARPKVAHGSDSSQSKDGQHTMSCNYDEPFYENLNGQHSKSILLFNEDPIIQVDELSSCNCAHSANGHVEQNSSYRNDTEEDYDGEVENSCSDFDGSYSNDSYGRPSNHWENATLDCWIDIQTNKHGDKENKPAVQTGSNVAFHDRGIPASWGPPMNNLGQVPRARCPDCLARKEIESCQQRNPPHIEPECKKCKELANGPIKSIASNPLIEFCAQNVSKECGAVWLSPEKSLSINSKVYEVRSAWPSNLSSLSQLEEAAGQRSACSWGQMKSHLCATPWNTEDDITSGEQATDRTRAPEVDDKAVYCAPDIQAWCSLPKKEERIARWIFQTSTEGWKPKHVLQHQEAVTACFPDQKGHLGPSELVRITRALISKKDGAKEVINNENGNGTKHYRRAVLRALSENDFVQMNSGEKMKSKVTQFEDKKVIDRSAKEELNHVLKSRTPPNKEFLIDLTSTSPKYAFGCLSAYYCLSPDLSKEPLCVLEAWSHGNESDESNPLDDNALKTRSTGSVIDETGDLS